MNTTILTVVQLGSAVLLIASILLQQRGEGLGGSFGGSSMEFSTRRGVQKWLLYATIAFVVIFIATSLARLVL